jgi:hypothetical protein
VSTFIIRSVGEFPQFLRSTAKSVEKKDFTPARWDAKEYHSRKRAETDVARLLDLHDLPAEVVAA